MPSLIEIPNEILYKIIDNVHPDDIIDFSLCCKSVHLLAKDAVSLHLRRTFRGGNFGLTGCHRHKNNSHPLRLIQAICMDWRVREYAKHLIVSCCHHPVEVVDRSSEEEAEIKMDKEKWKEEKEEDDIINHTKMHVIKGYIEEKALEFGFDVRGWCDLLRKGDRVVMLVIVFLCIPRLEKLCLHEFTWDANRLHNAIRAMFEQPGARRFLTNLSEVCLQGNEENRMGECFQSFMTFATLPSMRKISGELVQGFQKSIPEWTLLPNTSNITEIDLQRSAVKAENLTQVLVGIKSLKRFTFDQSVQMEVHKIVAALLQYAKHSLECLQLTGRCEEDDDIDSRRLQSFEVLKDVGLSLPLYVELLLHREGSPEGGLDRESVQALVYALPPSIESVSLVGPVFGHAATLLADFAEEKHIRLPQLKKVDLFDRGSECEEGWAKTWEEICESTGVTLSTERC